MIDLYKKITIPEENSLNSIFNDTTDNFFGEYSSEEDDENDLNELTTLESISEFFSCISELWKNRDFDKLSNELKSNKLTLYDDSFKEFEIANLAIEEFIRSDYTPYIIDQLNFFLELFKIDNKYIDDLLNANFLEAIFRVYKEVQACDFYIVALECVSFIAKTSNDFRNIVYSDFPIYEINNSITDPTVLSKIFNLISSILKFEIDEQMFKTIISFLISEKNLSIISPFLKDIYKNRNINDEIDKNDYDTQSKIDACQYYAICLWRLSETPQWIHFLDDNNLIDIFIDLLFCKDKIILKYSSLSLLPLLKKRPVNDEKFFISLINLLFNANKDVLLIACTIVKYLIINSDKELFSKTKTMIINQLFHIVDSKHFTVKIQAFITMSWFLFAFPEYLPYAITNLYLFDIIEDVHELDTTYYALPYTLRILDCIFTNEQKKEESTYLDEFINRGGMDQIEEILSQQNVEEEHMILAELFLTKYSCTSGNFSIEEVEI